MSRYPVISLTLKSAKQPVFESAYAKLKWEIADEFERHKYVLESARVDRLAKERFQKIKSGEAGYDDYSGALKFLSQCMYQATGKKTVICLAIPRIYNPWSVIKFLYDLRADVNAFPRPYWINTSSNDIVKELIAGADRETKGQVETLLGGGTLDFVKRLKKRYRDV